MERNQVLQVHTSAYDGMGHVLNPVANGQEFSQVKADTVATPAARKM